MVSLPRASRPVSPSLRLVAVALGVALLAGCAGKESRIESGLKKGAEFVQAGDYDKANVEIRNVLQIDPKNGPAYLIAGRMAEAQRDIRRAYGAYLKAAEFSPTDLEAKLGLARMYLYAGEIGKSRQHVNEVLAADQSSVGARTIEIALRVADGQPKEALKDATTLVGGLKSVPAETAMLLAGLHANEGQRNEALAVIDRALKDEPRNSQLLQVAASISAGDPASTKAVEYLKRSTDVAPKNDELWRSWMLYHVSRNEVDQAEAVLRDALDKDPDDAQRKLDLAEFLNLKRGPDVAERELRQMIGEAQRDSRLRFALARLYRDNGKHLEAQKVLRELLDQIEDVQSRVSARNQLAGYALVSGRSDEARTLVADVLRTSPRDNGALTLRARLHIIDGRYQDAVTDLRAVVRDQPRGAEGVALLAVAHRLAGERELAREVVASAAGAHPDDIALRELLVRQMVEARDYAGALKELDAGLKAAPLAVKLYDLKAQVALLQRDPALAERTLVALRDQDPDGVAGHVTLGRFLASQRKFDAALRSYDAAATLAPTDPAPYLASVGLLLGQRRFDEAAARIDKRVKAEPDNALHTQLRGDLALARGDRAAAEAAYRQVIEREPRIALGYLSTARLLSGQRNVDGAIALLAKAEDSGVDDLAVPIARAELLTRAGRYDDAIGLYEALVKRAPMNDDLANNLAYLLIEKKGEPEHLNRALEIAQRFVVSSNAAHLDTLGWVQHRLGQFDRAVPVLERAHALAPTSPLLTLHLGKALVKSGDTRRGRELLRQAIESKAELPDLDEARALLKQS